MAKISVIDIEYDGYLRWRKALAPHRAATRTLISAFNREGEKMLGPRSFATIKRVLDIGNQWMGGLFREEIEEIAAATGVPERDILTANLAYDAATVGCTAFLVMSQNGSMIHARNLDWEFPRGLLRKYTTLFRIHGAPVGDYALVGWPGLFSVLTGVAPGRFSLSVNHVMNRESKSSVGLAIQAGLGYWPSTWLTRRVMDEARSFQAACRILKNEPIVSPILYAVGGVKETERVVIERSPLEYVDRKASGTVPVCVTNHYVSEEFSNENVNLKDYDTRKRYRFISSRLRAFPIKTSNDAFQILSQEPLFDEITQYQVTMDAKSGSLSVRVPSRGSIELKV